MSEVEVVYALWKREAIKWFREPQRIIASIAQPIIWLLIFGYGLGSAVSFGQGFDYKEFIFPGIVGMSILFNGIFFGVSLIWDRQFGFLKEVLVAPVSRTSAALGKSLGGATMALFQGIIVLLISFLVGINITLSMIVQALPIMFLLSLGIVSMALVVGSYMKSMEGFQVVMTFLVMPMFLFSGAFFPFNNIPNWMNLLVHIDPITYGVDGIRNIVIGTSTFTLVESYLATAAFAILMLAVCIWRFKNIQ